MELEQALKECGALRFGEFTLASGQKSNYYIDIKRASTRPEILSLIAEMMAARINERPDRIAGVVLGSIPLATALSLRTGIPLLMVRKERKDHGTGSAIEGDLEEGMEVLVVEDVITSASSAIAAVKQLRENGATANKVMAVVDREVGGREALAAEGIELDALLAAGRLLKG